MTAPAAPHDTAITRDQRPDPRPDAGGYLVTSVGALVGVLLLAGGGVGVGVGLMELLHDPDAGLANLGLLIFPIGLGGIGTLVGAFLGVRTALDRRGYEDPARTAWMTVPLTVLGLGLLPAWGTGVVVLVAMPAGARWLALRA